MGSGVCVSLPFASSSVLYSFVRSISDSNLNVQMIHWIMVEPQFNFFKKEGIGIFNELLPILSIQFLNAHNKPLDCSDVS